jgi:hypothetical protein
MRTRIDLFFPSTEVACFNYLISDFIYVMKLFNSPQSIQVGIREEQFIYMLKSEHLKDPTKP